MPLDPGARLGPYEVTGKLGEGGMGEVYRARDTKLGRDVALKVLSASFADDPERIARFDREARTLAALNQPLIAQIYGFEQSGNLSALVMELVEGEDLAERIRRGALPLDDVIPIARQISEALEAAHEAGIVHRDLKPANIKLRPDGTVKILDFGLAKAFDPATGSGVQANVTQSPTITTPAMTMRGVILGTAAYMAPEQAKGRAVTKRADIWAFGCVLFEMLSGQRPFDGDDMTEVLAAVIKTDPDWTRLPAGMPTALRKLVQGCLEKDPRTRIADAAVIRYGLDHLTAATTDPATPPVRGRSWPVAAGGVAGVAALVALAVGATLTLNRPARQPYRFAIVPSLSQPLLATDSDRDIAITPNGRSVIYRASVGGVPKLVVRDVHETGGRILDGTDGGRSPFVSTDGQWVGYFVTGFLKKVLLAGGAPVTISAIEGSPRGASWEGDRIVFATSSGTSGILMVPAAGGEVKELTRPDTSQQEADHLFPVFSPGGSHVLFAAIAGQVGEPSLKSFNVASGEIKMLVPGGSQAQWAGSGLLIFSVGSTLRVAQIDRSRMELTSEPVPVLERLSTTNQGAANYVVSRDGLLVYVEGTDSMAVRRSLVWVSRDGREEVLKTEGRAFADPRLSADDRHAVVEINDQPDDIWTLDVARGTVTRQSFEVGEDETPIWMPDARSIVYSSSRAGQTRAIYGRRSDGVGGEDTYWSGREHVHVDDVTSDGRALIVSASVVNGGQADLMRVPLAGGDQKLEPLLQTPFTEYGARLSPDGRAIAYVSSESGGQEVYVRSFPSLENKTRVSTAGGIAPTWSRRGGELHFLTREAMMAVSVDTRSAIAVGTPQALFENRYFLKSTAHTAYDVARDGRFLMVKEVPLATQAGQAHLQIVLNWFEELEAKVR